MATFNEKMTAITNAIRAKTGGEERLTLDGIAEGVEEVYTVGVEQGKQAEHDAFWDALQDNGHRKSYYYAFSRWADEIFYPEYDIKPTSASGIFANSQIVDMTQRLKDCGVTLDLSAVTKEMTGAFQYSTSLKRLPVINVANCRSVPDLFGGCSSLEEVEKLVLNNDGTQSLRSAFQGCSNLVTINIEGAIGGTDPVKFQYSPKLSKASIESIIQHLSKTTERQLLTLSVDAVNKAFETTTGANDGETSDAWKELIATKSNWTISLI